MKKEFYKLGQWLAKQATPLPQSMSIAQPQVHRPPAVPIPPSNAVSGTLRGLDNAVPEHLVGNHISTMLQNDNISENAMTTDMDNFHRTNALAGYLKPKEDNGFVPPAQVKGRSGPLAPPAALPPGATQPVGNVQQGWGNH